MLSYATTIGRNHRLMQQNCQDFAQADSPQPGCSFGIVLDGCGGKHRETNLHSQRPQTITHPSHNEVGAKLLGQFTAAWLRNNLSRDENLDTLIDALYQASLLFLAELVALLSLPAEKANIQREQGSGIDLKLSDSRSPAPDPNFHKNRFIATHLLCTLLGFIVTPTTAAFFWLGDGYLCHNGRITCLDQHNRPTYLAYQLLGQGNAPFQRQIFAHSDDLAWLSVATDGWRVDQLTELATPRSPLELQRHLNVQARERGRFDDDGAVAVYYHSRQPAMAVQQAGMS